MTVQYDEIKLNLTENSRVILLLVSENPLNSIAIQKKLDLSQHKIASELSRLEGACLISKSRDPKDNRYTVYSITEHGKRIL